MVVALHFLTRFKREKVGMIRKISVFVFIEQSNVKQNLAFALDKILLAYGERKTLLFYYYKKFPNG